MSDAIFPPLPKKKPTRIIKGEVDAALANKALAYAVKANLSQKQVIEWGLQAFVDQYEKLTKRGRK